jgi:hypothetical protein
VGPGKQEDHIMAPISRINVGPFDQLGQLFIDWAINPGNRPGTLSDFQTMTTGICTVPSYVTTLEFAQRPKEVLFLRLPPKELIEDTLAGLESGGNYPMPAFYEDKIRNNNPADNKHFLRFRVGDYVIAHCT